jgi:hypothetical protein
MDICRRIRKTYDVHSDIEVILIVDEVQLIYKPQDESEPCNGGSIFWVYLQS